MSPLVYARGNASPKLFPGVLFVKFLMVFIHPLPKILNASFLFLAPLSLDSSGSIAVGDSDHESAGVKPSMTATIPEAPPLPPGAVTWLVSEPIPGESEFLLGDELPKLEDIIDSDQLQKVCETE